MTESGGLLQVNDSEIQPTFLDPSSPSIMCPSLPASKVLAKVDPETVIDCTYVTTEKESCYSTEKLETKLHRL
jgi:hypothetical protein